MTFNNNDIGTKKINFLFWKLFCEIILAQKKLFKDKKSFGKINYIRIK
jgi:hypothetical protein